MAAQVPHLTVARAKELAHLRGYVRVDLKSGSWHKTSARVVRVVNDDSVEVLPWHGHGKTEIIPLSALTEHKSKTQQHLELTMQRSPGALVHAAGLVPNASLPFPKPDQSKPNEPYYVVETEKKLVWGGPTGRHKGFQKAVNLGITFADNTSALRSIGKLKHTVGWQINVAALKAVTKSEALALLASRSSASDSEPKETITTPTPQLETPAPKMEVPPPVVEAKPIALPSPTVKSAPAPDLLKVLEEVGNHIRDFKVAVEMAHEARNLALKKMEQVTGNMDAVLAALEIKS
jgi:hypothetical protein